MDQYVLFNFAFNKDGKFFQFSMQPETSWEQIEAAVEDFKIEFLKLKEKSFADKAAMEAAKAIEAEIVPEVLNA